MCWVNWYLVKIDQFTSWCSAVHPTINLVAAIHVKKIWKNLVATIHVKKIWKWSWLLPYIWKKDENKPGCYDTCEKIMEINLVATIHLKKWWKWTWLLRYIWKNYENKPGCYDICEKMLKESLSKHTINIDWLNV